MFVVVHDNSVIFGPKTWNKLNFQEVILDDCEVECTLETRNDSNLPVVINDSIKILPVVRLPEPEFNGKIQRLDGPYWNFYDDKAEMYFTAGDLPIDAVKNMIKGTVAANRYEYEVKGFTKTIQGTEVTIDTARVSKDVFLQTYLTLSDSETVNWKFHEAWLTLTKSEIGEIVDNIKSYVQSSFTWEQAKVVEIDAANTLNDLDAIDLEVVV